MSRIKALGVLFAALATFFYSTNEAQAVLQIQISVNGGAFTTATAVAPFTTVALNTTVSGVSFQLSGSSNQPTGSPFSQVSQSNLKINNTGSSVTFNSIVIRVTDTNFSNPTGFANLSSSLSGSYGAGVSAVGNQAFQSFANLSNTAFATTGLTGGVQNFTLPAVATTTSFSGPNSNTIVNISATPFSLTNTFTFSAFTIAGGAQLQITGTTNLQSTPIPEPMTIVAALSGLPVLGGFMLRRRKVIA